MPFVNATNEQATLIDDEDANNSSDGNDRAAVANLQVPAHDSNAQRSEVSLADVPNA